MPLVHSRATSSALVVAVLAACSNTRTVPEDPPASAALPEGVQDAPSNEASPAAEGAAEGAAQAGDAADAAPQVPPLFAELEGALLVSRWSEGVAAADVENDGDLDLFFADGPAFDRPGQKLQNQLEINRLDEAVRAFSNESVLRLGRHASHAKMVVTGDIDGDGFQDALFCNAFNTDPPSLYHNRGAVQPGWFDHESAARGFTTPYNSGSGQFGDVDDDGDLDLVLCDSGEHILAGAGAAPHLFLNDGRGVFTERADLLPAPVKMARVDVQLADLDGDFDLDALFANRAENAGGNHDLLLNDGRGSFTPVSGAVPDASKNVYEIEVGDLDGDSDLDLFFLSLSDYSEGPAENRLVPDGALVFTAGTPLGALDDNEAALLDHDMDGDFDVVVGSLAGEEKILRNDGAFAFTQLDVPITGVEDPTLDLAVADIDRDGRFDIVTAQGEGNPARYTNRIFLGTGARDTRAPRVVGVSEGRFDERSNEWVVHVLVRDEVMDDGEDWVTASARVRLSGEERAARATRSAAGVWRFATPCTGADHGRTARFQFTFVDAAGNTTTAPWR
jgi:hypothetical protein